MVRATSAPASRLKRKRILRKAKGFWGDRKNHIRQSANAVMTSMANNYCHRKDKKHWFRSLWIIRIGVAAKMANISYSKLMCGLKKANVNLNRKMLSEIAINNPKQFSELADTAKAALKP